MRRHRRGGRNHGRSIAADGYPLLQDGPLLDRIRARLDARATKVEAEAQRSA